MTNKVLYEELCPAEFLERLEQCPIAYLPLGTLEWHGPHLPLGADGIQSQGFFKLLAADLGGIVMPPLFLGPDRIYHDPERELYGMDICTGGTVCDYPMQQLPGSAYWIPDELYQTLLMRISIQLKRAGFKILVAHGHGPSTLQFIQMAQAIEKQTGLHCMSCWDFSDDSRLNLQGDHAAANETSVTMALRPELVQLDRILSGDEAPIAVAGQDPRIHSSIEYGNEIIEYTKTNLERELQKLLQKLKENSGN